MIMIMNVEDISELVSLTTTEVRQLGEVHLSYR